MQRQELNPRAAYNEAFDRAQEKGGARWAVEGGIEKFHDAWVKIYGSSDNSVIVPHPDKNKDN